MNRIMLVVVGLLVVAGLAHRGRTQPTMIDRIESAESCSELSGVYADVRQEVGDRLDSEFQARARETRLLVFPP